MTWIIMIILDNASKFKTLYMSHTLEILNNNNKTRILSIGLKNTLICFETWIISLISNSQASRRKQRQTHLNISSMPISKEYWSLEVIWFDNLTLGIFTQETVNFKQYNGIFKEGRPLSVWQILSVNVCLFCHCYYFSLLRMEWYGGNSCIYNTDGLGK